MVEEQCPSVAEWLTDSTVFVTGALGFIGKILVEKLLRSNPDIRRIYILVRAKKGRTVQERLEVLKNSSAFDLLRKTNPSAFDKIVGVVGDVNELALGLSKEDADLLKTEVNLVFHVAASVKFDDTLSNAVFTNTRATREAVELARGMKNLQMFMYVSTAFTNCEFKVIEEKIYPAKIDWRKMIKAAETMGEQELNVFTRKLLGEAPNTYIFTKNMAEHVVWDHRHEIPLIIYRPSVVVCSIREPEPGWIDTLNSPLAMFGASGKGVLRIYGGPKENHVEYIAVDTAVNAMISAAWFHTVYLPRHPQEAVNKESKMVYNATTLALTAKKLSEFGLNMVDTHPMSNTLWRVYFVCIPHEQLFLLLTILLHAIPGMLMDLGLRIAGKKPLLTKLYRSIYVTMVTLKTFLYNEWIFDKTNFDTLPDYLNTEDRKTYSQETITETFTVDDYLGNASRGMRMLFKEPLEPSPEALKHTRRMYWVDMVFRVIFVGLLLWVLPLESIFNWTFQRFVGIHNFFVDP